MARNRRTGVATLGAMVLGVTAITGFAPPQGAMEREGAGSGPARERAVRAAVAAGVFSRDHSAITAGHAAEAGDARDAGGAGDAGEDFGAEYVRHRVARVLPGALAPICGDGYGHEVTFPLFDGVIVQAVETKRSTVGSTLVWHGTVTGTADQDVIVTLEGGCDRAPGNEVLSAQFLTGGDLYAVEPLGKGRVLVTQTTPLTDEDEPARLVPPATRPVPADRPPAPADQTAHAHHADQAHHADHQAARAHHAALTDQADQVHHAARTDQAGHAGQAAPAAQVALAGAVLSSPEAERAAAACKGGQGYSLVDVLVGYTPGARTEAGGDAQVRAAAARGVALANEAFAESGVKVRVRLVGTALASVPASLDGVTGSLLSAVATPDDGVADSIPQLRDQYGADLVSVLAAGRAAGGLGYTPSDPGPSTAAWGYSVVGRSAVSRFSLGHEIGHNLGADHDRVTQPVQNENGATGYFPAKGDWSSVMAYESSCRKATKGTCTRINRFGNPHRTYRGEPLGVPLGRPGQVDSTDVLTGTGKAVAAYRAAKTSDALCAVTASVAPRGAGTVTAGAPGPYPQGTTATYDAEAAKGYVFSGWKLDGKAVKGGATGFRVPAGDHTLVAEFRKGTTPTSTVTTRTSGSGTVRKAPAGRAEPAGADVLYEAVPAPGWDFAGWVLDGSHAGDHVSLAIDVGADDMPLTAVFEHRRHRLTVVERGRGTVRLSQDGPYSDGDTVIATAVPAPGFVFKDWLLDGEPYGGDEERHQGETSVLFDEEGHTLTAVFGRA
ncbi:InlB B-repeat-containing protein [Streptomyces sp. NPDC126499]|uniref:InlB B-repeat-containing protein n=1 Tax=Streptomyces sp. NPDC126499 TaxID=3155314 RepID=UPI0033345556